MAATITERLDKHDRQIAAIRDLVKEGMRLLVETRKDIRTLPAMHRKLEIAQERTDRTLRDFISSVRQGRNGHAKGPVS